MEFCYSNKRIFTLNLTPNRFGDPLCISRFRGYNKNVLFDKNTVDEVLKYAAEKCFDHLLIFVGDAYDYESHPEIAVEGALSKEEFIAFLKKVRSFGLTPLPMLDFGFASDAWLSKADLIVPSEEYLNLASDLIKELCEVFEKPELFHLGFGDESEKAQYVKALKRTRNGSVWFECVNRLCDTVRACGSRPWIWADNFLCNKKAFEENVSKDVVLSTQSYGYIKRFPNGSYRDSVTQSAVELGELGYTQIPASSVSFSMADNALLNMELEKFDLPGKCIGQLSNCLQNCDEDSIYELKYAVEAYYHGICQVFPAKKEAK